MRGILETAIGVDTISYEVSGPAVAPAVLLAHSIGTSRVLWDAQVASLAESWRVIRYDTRGHGKSSAPAADYDLDQLGRDALAVLDAAGVERAHIVGLSLGGLTAMWLAVHAPDRVERLVLANTAARIGSTDRWAERIRQVRSHGMASIVEETMRRWFSEAFRTRNAEIVAAYGHLLAGCSPAGYTGCCAALRDADFRDAIDRIAAPTLVVAGDQDQATTLDDANLMHARIPGARLAILPAAHLSNVEEPAAFTQAVRQFLEA